ncbi:hypothetical protein ACP4OV_001402 [Aristida adscensionis]
MEPRRPMELRRRAVSPAQFKYWELRLAKNPLLFVFISPQLRAVARRLAGALPPRRRVRLAGSASKFNLDSWSYGSVVTCDFTADF